MIDLGAALRELASTEPVATRVDPYEAIRESRDRSRRSHRWSAGVTLAAMLVAGVGVARFGAWLPAVEGLPDATVPAAAAPAETATSGHGIQQATAQLAAWAFTVSGWTRTDQTRAETWAARVTSDGGTMSVTFGTGTGVADGASIDACASARCDVVDDSGGSVQGVGYAQVVVRLAADAGEARYVALREFKDGTSLVVRIGPVVLVPEDATQIAGPYLTVLRLYRLLDDLGVPPARYQLKDQADSLCREAIPASASLGAAYHTSVRAVRQQHSWPSMTTPARDAWRGIDPSQDAALCITRTGQTWRIVAATTGAGPVVFLTTTQPLDTGRNSPAAP